MLNERSTSHFAKDNILVIAIQIRKSNDLEATRFRYVEKAGIMSFTLLKTIDVSDSLLFGVISTQGDQSLHTLEYSD